MYMYVRCVFVYAYYCVHERADERGFAIVGLIIARLNSIRRRIAREVGYSIFRCPLCSLLCLFESVETNNSVPVLKKKRKKNETRYNRALLSKHSIDVN